ncbi:MAG: AraC family transcriptional regulator [Desulfomonile tiedjei]|nr:AraC family transcriptional regulator [Desulfomonile tiedjei]
METERIPAEAAKWLVEKMLTRGIQLDKLLTGTGLDQLWLAERDPGITYRQYCQIVINAIDESGDPAIGLSAIDDSSYISRLGFWGYALASARTWRDANKIAMEFWEISGSLVRVSFTSDDKHAIWNVFVASPLVADRVLIFAIEKVIASACATIHFLTGSPPPLLEIQVSYAPPGHVHLYKKYFDCPVKFGCDRNLVRMDASVLERPLKMTSPQIAEVCKNQCQELLLKYRQSDDLVHMVRRMIFSSPGKSVRIQDIAEDLGLGARTLRRRLRERNITFKEILDGVRAEIARGYLTGTRLSIDQISGLVGFDEATNFRRAFKRWTGESAAAVRKSSREKHW